MKNYARRYNMIVRSLRKRLGKAEVYIEFNDPNKVIIRDIIDYYKYLDDLDTDPELDKKELIYKPPPRKSSKETFLDMLVKYDQHYAGYIGDEAVEKFCADKPHDVKEDDDADDEDSDDEEDTDEESEEITPEKSDEDAKSNPESAGTGIPADVQKKKVINIKSTEENEPPAEKIKRRKALECCGSFG